MQCARARRERPSFERSRSSSNVGGCRLAFRVSNEQASTEGLARTFPFGPTKSQTGLRGGHLAGGAGKQLASRTVHCQVYIACAGHSHRLGEDCEQPRWQLELVQFELVSRLRQSRASVSRSRTLSSAADSRLAEHIYGGRPRSGVWRWLHARCFQSFKPDPKLLDFELKKFAI